MCKGKNSIVADEVWEEDEQSNSSDDSEIESDPEQENKKPSPQTQSGYVQQPKLPKKFETQPAMLGMIAPSKTHAPAPEIRDTQGELVKLVNHLRNDNSRLHEALTQAQRSLEIVAENQAAREAAPNIDFAHLLALVKEFNDDAAGPESTDLETKHCENIEDERKHSPKVQTFAMADDDELEVSLLKAELENMRRETSQLRAELNSKDAELIKLRSNQQVRGGITTKHGIQWS